MRVRVAAIGRPMLPRGNVARNLAVVGGASVIGQGVLVLAAPVLARLYDPEAFGVYAVFAAILSVLLAASSLRYDLAVPLAQDRSEAVHLLAVSGVVALAVSGALGVAVLVAGPAIAATFGAPASRRRCGSCRWLSSSRAWHRHCPAGRCTSDRSPPWPGCGRPRDSARSLPRGSSG